MLVRLGQGYGDHDVFSDFRRDFGSVRWLASGRWQARYHGAVGRMLAAPQTFATKAEATGYLAALRTDQGCGVWVDPAVGQVPFGEYTATWMRLREIHWWSNADDEPTAG